MVPIGQKYSVFFLACLALCGIGCTDYGTPLDPGISLISGSWIWQRTEYFHVQGLVPPTPDNVIQPQAGFTFIIRFTFSGEYSETVNGVTELYARYELQAESSYSRVKYSNMMLSNGGVRDQGLFDQLAIVQRDTLRLRDIGPNGPMHTYARLR